MNIVQCEKAFYDINNKRVVGKDAQKLIDALIDSVVNHNEREYRLFDDDRLDVPIEKRIEDKQSAQCASTAALITKMDYLFSTSLIKGVDEVEQSKERIYTALVNNKGNQECNDRLMCWLEYQVWGEYAQKTFNKELFEQLLSQSDNTYLKNSYSSRINALPVGLGENQLADNKSSGSCKEGADTSNPIL